MGVKDQRRSSVDALQFKSRPAMDTLPFKIKVQIQADMLHKHLVRTGKAVGIHRRGKGPLSAS
jgi:hypothetical protein